MIVFSDSADRESGPRWIYTHADTNRPVRGESGGATLTEAFELGYEHSEIERLIL